MTSVVPDAFERIKNVIAKRDEVKIDNFLFQLHHQMNFIVLLVGFAFTFAENYIDGDAITCTDKDGKDVNDYKTKFCFIHGSAYIKDSLQTELTGRKCRMSRYQPETRVTAYYMWLPLILTICMAITKMPRMFWKRCLEKGFLKNLLSGRDDGEKIAKSFLSIKKRNKFMMYNLSYAFCEILNIICVLINFHILDHLLNGMFWTYGRDVYNFISYPPYIQKDEVDPMCNVFPTEVSCSGKIGSIGGTAGEQFNLLCILSNNVINQKYFLIVWWWWVILLAASILGMVYRIAQITIPSVSYYILKLNLDQAALAQTDPSHWKLLKMSSADLFMLSRMSLSLDKEVMTKVSTILTTLMTAKTQLKVLTELKSQHTNNDDLQDDANKEDVNLIDKVTFQVKNESVNIDL